jgi:hypothetical protein
MIGFKRSAFGARYKKHLQSSDDLGQARYGVEWNQEFKSE